MDGAMDGFAGGDAMELAGTAEADAKRFLVGVHLNPKLLNALERYRAGLDEDVSRPRAIRQILLQWLKANGQL